MFNSDATDADEDHTEAQDPTSAHPGKATDGQAATFDGIHASSAEAEDPAVGPPKPPLSCPSTLLGTHPIMPLPTPRPPPLLETLSPPLLLETLSPPLLLQILSPPLLLETLSLCRLIPPYLLSLPLPAPLPRVLPPMCQASWMRVQELHLLLPRIAQLPARVALVVRMQCQRLRVMRQPML